MNRKGSISAANLLAECGIVMPTDLSLEDIILCQGAYIQEKPMDGAEGRIMFDNENEALITINSNITYYPKKRFILAHELGHCIMHRKLYRILSDNDISLNNWSAKESIELEANDFAAEFLMPAHCFIQYSKGRLNFSLIKKISDVFQTSITSTLLRYRDLGDFPIALIYSELGLVKWTLYTHDFVLQFIPISSKLPVNTVAYEIYFKNYIQNEEEIVDAIDWFPNDFNINRYKSWKFYEYSFKINSKSTLTCLWGY